MFTLGFIVGAIFGITVVCYLEIASDRKDNNK